MKPREVSGPGMKSSLRAGPRQRMEDPPSISAHSSLPGSHVALGLETVDEDR